MENPSALADDAREHLEKFMTVVVIAIDLATFVSAAGDVPDGTGEFES